MTAPTPEDVAEAERVLNVLRPYATRYDEAGEPEVVSVAWLPLRSRLASLLAANREAREALLKHGVHATDCPSSCVARENEDPEDDACECGLRDALSRLAAREGGSR